MVNGKCTKSIPKQFRLHYDMLASGIITLAGLCKLEGHRLTIAG